MRKKTEVKTVTVKTARGPVEVKMLIVAGVTFGFKRYASFVRVLESEQGN